ncbi:MAG: hypothetical protein ABI607_03260 [Betaproteobacteria bacterium]
MTAVCTLASSDGEGYELQMGHWSRRLAPSSIRFAGTSGAVRVLDVGCGTDNLAMCLANDPESVGARGLNLSATYVEYANRCNVDARLASRCGKLARPQRHWTLGTREHRQARVTEFLDVANACSDFAMPPRNPQPHS